MACRGGRGKLANDKTYKKRLRVTAAPTVWLLALSVCPSVCLSVCLSVSPGPSLRARLSLRTEGVAAREKLIHVDVFEPFEVAQIPGQADLQGRGLGRMV